MCPGAAPQGMHVSERPPEVLGTGNPLPSDLG